MKPKFFLNAKGFSLTELTIAAGIMTVVVFGGYKAYTYFNSQTIQEAKKLDNLSEFNIMAKDLLNFTEGAGISSFYLNLPIKAKNCNATEPCVRQLVNQNFIAPTTAIPEGLTSNDCVQFYKDAKGTLDFSYAFPGQANSKDKVWSVKDLDLSAASELYATWILEDTNSPPFTMVKARDNSLHFSMINSSYLMKTINDTNKHQNYGFFVSDSPQSSVIGLTGYPFLIYNSVFPSHFTIQSAEEIVSCELNRSKCLNLMSSVVQNSAIESWSDTSFNTNIFSGGMNFPKKVYVIKFKHIDFSQPYFKEIVDRQQLSSNCLSSWGDGIQPAKDYFFPSLAYSVSKDPNADSSSDESVKILTNSPFNPLFLNKYHLLKAPMANSKPSFVGVPIDIVTLRVENGSESGSYQLISQMWHSTEIKKKNKIRKLTQPFIITRKLGSPEMGIWYNPIKK